MITKECLETTKRVDNGGVGRENHDACGRGSRNDLATGGRGELRYIL